LRADPTRTGPTYEEQKIEQRMVELSFREEVMWRQRSRVQWLNEGDKNTRFFHQKASNRKKKNCISRLVRGDGSICDTPHDLEQHTKEFYEDLFSSEEVIGIEEVLSHVPCKVTSEMNVALNAQYTAKEVKDALFQMIPTKAPGPDGFPAHFFQKHWHLCGEEITDIVIRVLNGNDSFEEINKTFIVLIPKVQNPTSLSQYRPISFCNVIFKIASKVLANRLKQILPKIISEEQSAFVSGRLITDNVITAYECLHFMKKNRSKRNGHCALKLDMRKAYDRIEWSYLEAIMKKLGISHRFVDTIMRGVRSVSFSILLNGSPTEEFRPSRGVRQGDPISPYLFLLAAEGLSCLLKDAMTAGSLEGIQVAQTAPKVNHLLFADDCLLFCKASSVEATSLRSIIEQYCNASGQRVNYDKSSIYFGKKVSRQKKLEIKGILDVSSETLNEKYLGLPSDVGRSKNGTFAFLKERIWKRLQGWMEKLLSSGGNEILIKSVVQAIPTYSMALFKLPRGLCQHITSLIRKFWWGSKQGERKTAWVSWESMAVPKYRGCMSFRDIEIFKLALLAHQAWRVLQDPGSLSARMLKAVYFSDTDILSATLGANPSQIWRALCEGRDVLKQGLVKRIGDGRSTSVRDKNWIPRDFSLRPLCAKQRNPPQRVCDLMCAATRTWNSEALNHHLLPMDVEVVKQIPLSYTVHQDSWAWHYEQNGFFQFDLHIRC
jgi:hypothetical protein